MKIYLFWSQTDTEVFGLTADGEGRNLPGDLAPWSKNTDGGPIYTCSADTSAIPCTSNPVIVAVKRDGFYLASVQRGPRNRKQRPAVT